MKYGALPSFVHFSFEVLFHGPQIHKISPARHEVHSVRRQLQNIVLL